MNNFITNKQHMSTLFKLCLFAGSIFFACVPPLNAAPIQEKPQQQLSPEDLKLLEEVEQQINNYVASLPPEKQQEFWDDVKKESEKMSKMSEDDLVQYMEKVFSEELPPAEQPVIEAPAPIAPVKEAKIEERPAQPMDKQQAALKLIDSMITRTSNFLRKAQTVVGLSGKVINWIKEGKLKNWPATLTWDVFKGHIDELNQKISKLKDKDPKTNKYKYLDDFIKDESLYNNLSKINDVLTKNEPLIEVSSFGIDKMATESREAIRKVLMSLHEAHTLLGIPQAIDKIFEKYEPTAKKLKESEEATSKQALELSKRPRTAAPAVVGGTPQDRRSFSQEKPRSHDYDYGRYTPSSNYDFPDRKGEKRDESSTKKTDATGGGEGGKEGDKKPADKPADKPKVDEKESKSLEDAISSLEKSFDLFMVALDGNKNLENIKDHIRNDSSEADLKLSASFTTAKNEIGNAIAQIKRVKRRMTSSKLSDTQKKEYVGLVKNTYKEYKNTLERIANEIAEVKKDIETIATIRATNGPIKKYAYFGLGNKNALEEKYKSDEKKAKLISNIQPIDLTELQESILDLKKVVQEL